MAARRTLLVPILLLAGCSALGGAGGPSPDGIFSGDDLELARAISARDDSRVADLVASGADVEATGRDEITILQWAVEAHHPAAITLLLDAGADPNRTGIGADAALHRAVRAVDLVDALLAGGADPDVRNAVTGSGPLTEVCVQPVMASFDSLVAAGADVHLTDWLGETPLLTCARTNQGALILRLLELGADPTVTSGGATFQDFYFGIDPRVLNDRAIAERRQIVAWLVANGYPLVAAAEQFR